jgi:hypothetical protein
MSAQYSEQPAGQEPAPLSPQRAFVVHFHAVVGEGQAPLSGRVEHVTSGKVRHFRSWPELAAFVAQTLS